MKYFVFFTCYVKKHFVAYVVLENCKCPKGNNNSNSSSSGRGNYKLLVNEAKRPQLVLQLMVENVMNFDCV